MTDGRCSCFSGKVLQKVLSVDDKNMDGTRLMNHSILCAEKWGRENYAPRWRKIGTGVKTVHQKTTPAVGKHR